MEEGARRDQRWRCDNRNRVGVIQYEKDSLNPFLALTMEEEGEEPRLAAGKGKEMDFFLQPQKVIKPALSKSDK